MDKPNKVAAYMDKPNKVAAKTKKAADEEKEASQLRWRFAMMLNFLVAAFGGFLTFTAYSSISPAKRYLQFVDGFDGGEILMMLAVVGVINALVGLFGASVCSSSASVKKYRRMKYMVFAYIGWGVGLFVLTGASCGLTYATILNLGVIFKPGFTESLSKYERQAAVKDSIDAIQDDLKCCGNFNHTEWYTVSWTDAPSKANVGIPKSCCDKNRTAAQKIDCATNVPFGESIRLTPYAKGCVSVLVPFYEEMLKKVTYILAIMTLISGAIVFMVIFEAQSLGEPGTTKKEKGNLPKKQGGKKETPGGKKETPDGKKETPDGKKDGTKEEDSEDSDEEDDDEKKPRQAALSAHPSRAMMRYPVMSYPYGYGAAPAMPYGGMPAMSTITK